MLKLAWKWGYRTPALSIKFEGLFFTASPGIENEDVFIILST
jgi:hypothetical protein